MSLVPHHRRLAASAVTMDRYERVSVTRNPSEPEEQPENEVGRRRAAAGGKRSESVERRDSRLPACLSAGLLQMPIRSI